MNDQRNFALQPLSATLKWMTLVPLLLTSTHAFARTVVDGQPRDIDGSVAADQYLLRNQASLTATGASTNDIRAESNSSLTLNGSTVTSAVSTIGVELVNSQATINRSTVTGARVGLSLGSLASTPVGSTATVTDSVITGGTTGIEVGSLGNLTLTRAVVTGSSAVGSGLQLSSGTVSATASTIRGGAQGVRFVPGSNAGELSKLVLDNSLVQGQSGSAILINDFGLAPILATIEVNNGSTLVGGNGKILEVDGSSTANMIVDNSHLVGDVVAQPTLAGQTRAPTMYVKEFFVQCHKVENLMVSASIRSDNRETFYSNPSKDDGEHNNKTCNLVAVAPPEGGTVGQVLLTFGDGEPLRVEGDGDDVTLNNTYYYYLKLMIKGVQVRIKDIEFVGNSSMVKWESDTQLEDVFSITGYALSDVKNAQGQQILHIDDILLRRLDSRIQVPLPIVNPSFPVPEGQVLFSLHRREYWQFDRYAKADFDTSLHVIVIDVYGNKHSVRIGFDGNNRNKLRIIGA